MDISSLPIIDGDWIVDWFEVFDDEEDGIRGDSSPLRYDSRQTG